MMLAETVIDRILPPELWNLTHPHPSANGGCMVPFAQKKTNWQSGILKGCIDRPMTNLPHKGYN
jgi:hypothetical protein